MNKVMLVTGGSRGIGAATGPSGCEARLCGRNQLPETSRCCAKLNG
jgi:NADP-dependent 3-hydroxy acid dehydrogenase YdfG